MKGAFEAHNTTTQALYDLHVEAFFVEHPHTRGLCVNSEEHVGKSCAQHNWVKMAMEQVTMLATFESTNVLETMAQFDKMNEARSPLFKFVRHYMQIMLLMYVFIRATGDSLWDTYFPMTSRNKHGLCHCTL